MEIYLIRHAEAVNAGQWRGSDADRPLTPMGAAVLEAGAKEMKRLRFSVPLVLTSPYLRAKETAAILTSVLGLSQPILNKDLSSGTGVEILRKIVVAHADKGPLLLVGHNPEISVFGSRIASEPQLLDMGLHPADMLMIETGPLEKTWGEGKIIWWRKIGDWKTVKEAS